VAGFLRDFLPGIKPVPVRHSVCMYTRTPDCHFCIDRHPEYETISGLVLFRFSNELFFANASFFRDETLRLVAASDPPARTQGRSSGRKEAVNRVSTS